MQRSLILGACSNLALDHLRPFVTSLKSTGFDGRLCIIAAGYGPRELEELSTLADTVRSVDGEYEHETPLARSVLGYVRRRRGLRSAYPFLFETVARTASERRSFEHWKSLEFTLEGLQSLRYMHYQRCLVEDAPEAEIVMISDLRDVVFQDHPFAEPVTELELYLEDSSVRIGDDAFNTRWLIDLYGKEFVKKLRGQPISCSGTVVGTRAAMLTYLSEMIEGIAWRRRPMGPHDQGVHNGLIQTGRLPFARLIPNEQGRVLTLGQMKAPRIDNEGVLRNADGGVPAVVHQWDRHPELVVRLRALRSAGGGK
jgi:hypothetical protein